MSPKCDESSRAPSLPTVVCTKERRYYLDHPSLWPSEQTECDPLAYHLANVTELASIWDCPSTDKAHNAHVRQPRIAIHGLAGLVARVRLGCCTSSAEWRSTKIQEERNRDHHRFRTADAEYRVHGMRCDASRAIKYARAGLWFGCSTHSRKFHALQFFTFAPQGQSFLGHTKGWRAGGTNGRGDRSVSPRPIPDNDSVSQSPARPSYYHAKRSCQLIRPNPKSEADGVVCRTDETSGIRLAAEASAISFPVANANGCVMSGPRSLLAEMDSNANWGASAQTPAEVAARPDEEPVATLGKPLGSGEAVWRTAACRLCTHRLPN